MKKTLKSLLCLLLVVIFLFSLCSCAHNKFFSKFLLKMNDIPDLPRFSSKQVEKKSNRVYHFAATEEEYNNYVVEVYEYLKSLNLKYLGNCGECVEYGFLGTYYTTNECSQLSDFLYKKEFSIENPEPMSSNISYYVFVWSNSGSLDDGLVHSANRYLTISYYDRSGTMVLELTPSLICFYVNPYNAD